MDRIPRMLIEVILAISLIGAGALHLALVPHDLDESHHDLSGCAVCQASMHGAGAPESPATPAPNLAETGLPSSLPGVPNLSSTVSPTPTRAPPAHA